MIWDPNVKQFMRNHKILERQVLVDEIFRERQNA